MTVALVQANKWNGVSAQSPRFAVAPTPGNLVLILQWGSNIPPQAATYTDVFGVRLDSSAVSTWGRLWSRMTQSGDPAIYPGVWGTGHWVAAEFSGVPLDVPISPGTTIRHASDNHPHHAFAPVGAGEMLIVGAAYHANTTGAAFLADAGYTMAEKTDFGANGNCMGIYYKIDPTGDGSYDPGVTTAPFNGIWSAGSVAWAGAPSSVPSVQSGMIS